MVKVTHKSAGLGLEVKTAIWDEAHNVEGIGYAKTMFFDVDGKAYLYEFKFGYTTIGGSGETISSATTEYIKGSLFTCPENAEAQSITVALRRLAAGSDDAKCAIYKHSDLSLVGVTEEKNLNLTTGFQWFTFNFTGTKPSLTKDVEYVLVVWADYTASDIILAFTTGATNQAHRQAQTYNSFPDPYVPLHYNYKHSIYCTCRTLEYVEIPATRVKMGNDYIKPQYARIIARASGDEAGTKKLKIHDGNADVAEVTWTGSGAKDLASSWTPYTDETDRTMSVYYSVGSTTETLTLYNVALEMR